MRDYSQHEHLPVNRDGAWYGFDLYGDIPRLSLAMTVAKFTANLLAIYHQFWISVEPKLITSEKEFKMLIANHPANVNVIGEQKESPERTERSGDSLYCNAGYVRNLLRMP